MAVIAANSFVRAVQWEIGLYIVVELPLQPVNRVMARGAVVLEATVVRIVLTVAIHAILGCILENLRFVTSIAFLVAMLTE